MATTKFDKPLGTEISTLNSKINNLLAYQTFTISSGLPSFAAESSNYVTFTNIAKEGYTPIGLLTYSGSNTTGLVMQEYLFVSSNTGFRIYLRNPSGTARTPTSLSVTILYIKNS